MQQLYVDDKNVEILAQVEACLPKNTTGNFIAEQERSDVMHDLLVFLADGMQEINKQKRRPDCWREHRYICDYRQVYARNFGEMEMRAIDKLLIAGIVVLISGILLLINTFMTHRTPNNSDTIGLSMLLSLAFLFIGFVMTATAYLTYVGEAKEEAKEREEKMREEYAISRLKNVFIGAGYPQNDVEELTKFSVVMLKEGTTYGDWTDIGPTKLITTAQAAATLLGKKPPGSMEYPR